ncbi:MAG: carboxylating nicotinate-nucleotide diphosphorylase [Planctomycetota bacterium]
MATVIDPNELDLAGLYKHLSAPSDRGPSLVRRLLELARDEDLGGVGDITAEASLTPDSALSCILSAREPVRVAGLRGVPELIEVFGGGLVWQPLAEDGDQIEAGAALGRISGPARSVVSIERTLLNLVGRLSGVAMRTASFVEEARRGSGSVRVLDTRKTTPGMRVLEKYAVRCGGGHSHRLGLHDAVLVKDNHIAHVPDDQLEAELERLASRARNVGDLQFVEFEVDRMAQLRAAVSLPEGMIDIVLLDNFSNNELCEAVTLRDAESPGLLLEASGGVRLDTIRSIAATGVDRISVGSLTHGATNPDIGLDADAVA